jgi:hypothetical protein
MAECKNPAQLSKSKFVAGVQCLKRLYWLVHEPKLKPEPDETTQAIFDQGHEVEEAARKAFPGGVVVKGEHWEVQSALRQTAQLTADPNVSAIFEAAFLADRILVRVDILQRPRGGKWRLIEVKSTTGVKEEAHHLEDVAIQKHVLQRAGVPLSSTSLMHLNRKYVYDGVRLVPDELFTIADISRQLSRIEENLPRLLKQQRAVLAQTKPPTVEPGDQCTRPYICEFYDLCNKAVPDDYVGNLPGIRRQRVQQLSAMGVTKMRDIPADFPLSSRQWRACQCVTTNKPYFGPRLRRELAQLKYPVFFMDFETFNPALPRFAKMRPFDHIPFQWSVHVQQKPDAPLEHHEFLSDDGRDPRREFVESLLKVLEDGRERGSIVVYNRSFEAGRMADLAGWLPEYDRRIGRIQSRLWDLLPVLREQVYHPSFCGSFSMKDVLPALVPGMSYEDMEVAEGGQAGLAYNALVREALSVSERNRLRKALLAYCKQDSLGMVRVLKKLEDHALQD